MTDNPKTEIITKEDTELMATQAFVQMLVRNNAKIRQDRADVIAEVAQVTFKRAVEDIELRIRKLKRERENMLDLSPDHALSLKLAEDFDAQEFTEKDISIGVQIRNEEIRLEIATKRYNYLFGGME